MSGQIIFNIAKWDLHLKYKNQLIDFYKQICDHKDDEVRMSAVYNLPCMNYYFKQVEDEVGVLFQEFYFRFTEDEELPI